MALEQGITLRDRVIDHVLGDKALAHELGLPLDHFFLLLEEARQPADLSRIGACLDPEVRSVDLGDQLDGRGTVAVGEAVDVAQSREQRLRHGEIHTGQRHQQFGAGILVSLSCQTILQQCDLGLCAAELAQVAVERPTALGIQFQRRQPAQVGRAEQIAFGWNQVQPLQQRAQLVFGAGLLGDQALAMAHQRPQFAHVHRGHPDRGDHADGQQLGQDHRVFFVGFNQSGGDQLDLGRMADHHPLDQGFEQVV